MPIPDKLPAHPAILKYSHWNSKKALFTTETGIGKALKKVEGLLNAKIGPNLLRLQELSQKAVVALARAKAAEKAKQPPPEKELGEVQKALKEALPKAEQELKTLDALKDAARELWVRLADWKKAKAKLPAKSGELVVQMEKESNDYLMRMNHIVARGSEDITLAKSKLKALNDAAL